MRTRILVVTAVVGLCASGLGAQRPLKILFLSKSAGFEHSSIREADGEESHVAGVLRRLAVSHRMEILTTKDAGLINAEDLEEFDVVIFYTTGDLTQAGAGGGFRGDGQPPMGPKGVAELIAWIEAGGGFVGYHSASDTFHGSGGEVSPYIRLLGGEFRTHGRQFTGTIRVVDPKHPTMKNVPHTWSILDEWYLFKNFNRDSLHVLALLDPGAERERQKAYDLPAYPVIWCSSVGQGRVYYNAMGHREDVWDDPTFQQSVVDAIAWAAGRGEARSAPNFHQVVAAGE